MCSVPEMEGQIFPVSAAGHNDITRIQFTEIFSPMFYSNLKREAHEN